MITRVGISDAAEKDLKRVPKNIVRKLFFWVELVENNGLAEVRKIPGFHDEPLKGRLKGTRSIRLSNAYRAFYVIKVDNTVELVSIEAVNKHYYR